jgi:hypothetical protein
MMFTHAAWRICALAVLCLFPALAQIVPILGTDPISESRVVINNNFAYLDQVKVETASNVGSLGVGLFKLKSAKDLQFYKLNSANSLLSIALSGTDFLQFTMSPTPSFTSVTLSGNLTRTGIADGCANWTSGVLGSSGTACGSGGGGEANVTADLGGGLSLRGTTAKSGVALNLRTLAATAPLTVTQGSDLVTFAMPAATGSVSGYLSSANFATFAAKYGSGDSPSFVNLTLSGAFTKTGTVDGCASWSGGVLGSIGTPCGSSSGGTGTPPAIITMSGAQRSIPFATHGITGPVVVTCKDASGNYSPNAYSSTAAGSNFDLTIGAMTGTCYVASMSSGGGGAGTGTVTSVGFTGGLISVATPTSTPALTVAGTSGGIPYFSSASTWATSAALGANLPVFGGGAGVAPFTGFRSGSTTTVVTTTGTQTNGRCVEIDALGNHIASAAPCGTGGTGIATMTTGAVDPSAACTAPSASNLVLYTQTATQDLWACVATNTWKRILSTLGTGTYVVTGTAGTVPATPAAGSVSCYFNSTSKVQVCVDDAGATSETIRTPTTLVRTIASGSTGFDPGSIASGTCASATTAVATGAATTDVISFTPNADITAVLGYTGATTGGIAIHAYPTANQVNFKACNPTASALDPGAITINWRISR